MPETPETHNRAVKMQKDIEELKEDIQDTWHLNRERYEKMVDDVFKGDVKCALFYLEVDGVRTVREIEANLALKKAEISQPTIYRAVSKLVKKGFIEKAGVNRSGIFKKKRWAIALHMDDYVRELIEKSETKTR